MRPYRFRVGRESNMTGVLIRRGIQRHRHTGEKTMTLSMETNTQCSSYKPKEGLRLPATSRSWKR